jgi:hypothetical protein
MCRMTDFLGLYSSSVSTNVDLHEGDQDMDW